MAEVKLRGKPSNRMYQKQNIALKRKVKWLTKQLNKSRKMLNSCQRTFELIARVDPNLAVHCLPYVPDVVIIRAANDPSGVSDRFEFPMLSPVTDTNPSSETDLDAAA